MNSRISALSLAGFALAAIHPAWAWQPDAAQPAAPQRLKDQMRTPWMRGEDRFIRRWLVLGDIPLTAANGFEKDFLGEHGGEAAIRPVENMAHRLPDGSPVVWRSVTAWGDATEVANGRGLKRDLVAYAFATVQRAAAGKALLSIGSDESIRVWVNGALVLDRRTRRQLVYDEDQVEVDLKAGDNALLVKLEQRAGPWTFSARVLERGAIPPRVQEIGPSIVESSDAAIAVRTDVNKERAALDKVTVQAVAAGGRIAAERVVTRGETVRFDAAAWPAGAYEIRLVTRRMNGLLYATHLPWYKGDAIAATRDLLASAAKADGKTPVGATTKMLADMVKDRLGDPSAVTGNPWWAIHSPLMEFEELKLESAGKPARERPYGFVRLAYFDDVDGSPQFCRAYLPGGYDRAKKYPVVIRLHGYNPENPEYVRWWSVDVRHLVADVEYTGRQGVIYLEPHGRGNTSYQGLGDRDVMRVAALAKERFSVDSDRIYLVGESMGGWGTWNVGTRHPDVFAAIAPVYGGSDYHSEVPEEQLKKLAPLDRFLLEKNSSWSMAEGLLHTPILVHHGDVDRSVNVEYSRYGVRMLERWGYNVRYIELPGYGHEELNVWGRIVDWLLQYRRVANPARVRIRSAEPRNASAWWVHVDQQAAANAFMELDAEVTGPNLIRVDSANVLALTLSPGTGLVDTAKPLRIVWNGEPRSVTLKSGRATLRANGYAPAALEKNAEVSGPAGDIFNTPFAIVVGTASADAAMNEICRRKGEAAVKFWQQWQRQPARLYKDTEITGSDAARHSLLLIGGPDSNLVARRLATKLPLEIAPGRVRIGRRTFEAADARVQMIYPNPFNADRYVVIAAGTSANGLYFWSPDRLRSVQFDFTIEDGHVPAGRERVPDADLWVAGGWFDNRWEVRDDFVFPGNAEARAKSMLLRAPDPNRVIDGAILDSLAGTYELGPQVKAVVHREASRLIVQVNSQPPIELAPVSDTEFFIVEGPAKVTFRKDSAGKVTGLQVWQNGQEFILKKTQ